MNPRKMQSGRLRQLVTWMQASPPTSRGTTGQASPTFVDMGTFWAEVIAYDGDQVVNADQKKPLRKLRVTMRYGPAIKAGDRLIFEGRTLTVNTESRVEERDFWIELTCVEQARGEPGGP